MVESSNNPAEIDTGLQCLGLLLRFYKQPADIDQIRHQSGKAGEQLNAEDITRCAKRSGLLARLTRSNWQRLERTPLPAIAELADGTFVIFARVIEGKLLVHDPRQVQPETRTREQIEAVWNGTLILATHRDALAGPSRGFDLSWFIPSIIKYRRLLTEVLAASFFLQLFGLVTPLFFQVVTDKVLVHRGLSSLEVLVFGLAVVSLFEVILGALRTYVFSHTTNRIDVELGASLFQHLMGLPTSYFATRTAGNTVARVRELENIRTFVTGSSVTLIMDTLFTIVFFMVMFSTSTTLTLIVLATVPLYIILSFVVTPILRKRIEARFRHGAENQSFLVEAVTGAETLKAMAVEPQMQRRWEGLLAAYVQSTFKVQNLNAVASQLAQGISKAQTVLVLWIGAVAVMNGEITIGALVAFNMLAARVSSPILRLAQMWQDFQQMRVSVDRLGDILNTPTERTGSARSALPSVQGRITFDNVTFRYRSDRPEVLRRISLDIAPGQNIGIVGGSGSGKSTLAKLVQRLYLPESGRVLIDGVDLALIDPAWLRRQMGVVLQENILFNRTVRENIALSDPSLPMEAVIAAAKMAAAHEFILELPQAYDTIIDERGANLSGGQRQRIAIARALISNPRFLIFDEATAALDYESEAQIRRNMAFMARGRTVLTIAHRLSAVRHCDRILVLDKGAIVEDGKHDALIAYNGRYAQLWRAQEAGHVAA